MSFASAPPPFPSSSLPFLSPPLPSQLSNSYLSSNSSSSSSSSEYQFYEYFSSLIDSIIETSFPSSSPSSLSFLSLAKTISSTAEKSHRNSEEFFHSLPIDSSSSLPIGKSEIDNLMQMLIEIESSQEEKERRGGNHRQYDNEHEIHNDNVTNNINNHYNSSFPHPPSHHSQNVPFSRRPNGDPLPPSSSTSSSSASSLPLSSSDRGVLPSPNRQHHIIRKPTDTNGNKQKLSRPPSSVSIPATRLPRVSAHIPSAASTFTVSSAIKDKAFASALALKSPNSNLSSQKKRKVKYSISGKFNKEEEEEERNGNGENLNLSTASASASASLNKSKSSIRSNAQSSSNPNQKGILKTPKKGSSASLSSTSPPSFLPSSSPTRSPSSNSKVHFSSSTNSINTSSSHSGNGSNESENKSIKTPNGKRNLISSSSLSPISLSALRTPLPSSSSKSKPSSGRILSATSPHPSKLGMSDVDGDEDILRMLEEKDEEEREREREERKYPNDNDGKDNDDNENDDDKDVRDFLEDHQDNDNDHQHHAHDYSDNVMDNANDDDMDDPDDSVRQFLNEEIKFDENGFPILDHENDNQYDQENDNNNDNDNDNDMMSYSQSSHPRPHWRNPDALLPPTHPFPFMPSMVAKDIESQKLSPNKIEKWQPDVDKILMDRYHKMSQSKREEEEMNKIVLSHGTSPQQRQKMFDEEKKWRDNKYQNQNHNSGQQQHPRSNQLHFVNDQIGGLNVSRISVADSISQDEENDNEFMGNRQQWDSNVKIKPSEPSVSAPKFPIQREQKQNSHLHPHSRPSHPQQHQQPHPVNRNLQTQKGFNGKQSKSLSITQYPLHSAPSDIQSPALSSPSPSPSSPSHHLFDDRGHDVSLDSTVKFPLHLVKNKNGKNESIPNGSRIGRAEIEEKLFQTPHDIIQYDKEEKQKQRQQPPSPFLSQSQSTNRNPHGVMSPLKFQQTQ